MQIRVDCIDLAPGGDGRNLQFVRLRTVFFLFYILGNKTSALSIPKRKVGPGGGGLARGLDRVLGAISDASAVRIVILAGIL